MCSPTRDPSIPTFWSRRGDAIAAIGESDGAASASAPAACDLGAQWRALAASAEIDDPVGLPGTGLIAFGAFAFDPRSDTPSTLSVPAVVVGRRGGRSWVTRISSRRRRRRRRRALPAAHRVRPVLVGDPRPGGARSRAATRPPSAAGSTRSPRAR